MKFAYADPPYLGDLTALRLWAEAHSPVGSVQAVHVLAHCAGKPSR